MLLHLGFSHSLVRSWVATGRLRRVHRGVYALGPQPLTQQGRWTAAVIAGGNRSALSHTSAGALYGLIPAGSGPIHVTVPGDVDRKVGGVRVHRRTHLTAQDTARRHRIPVTTPLCTLVDLASMPNSARLERAIGQADVLGLITPEALRARLDDLGRRPGLATLRAPLDRSTFTLTDSELERRFLPIARRAGLPQPNTREKVNGFRVDFYWSKLKLIVETDGLRYHRTAAQQTKDRVRDQAHLIAGCTQLRFSHAQVAHDPKYVEAILRTVASRLARETRIESGHTPGLPGSRDHPRQGREVG